MGAGWRQRYKGADMYSSISAMIELVGGLLSGLWHWPTIVLSVLLSGATLAGITGRVVLWFEDCSALGGHQTKARNSFG